MSCRLSNFSFFAPALALCLGGATGIRAADKLPRQRGAAIEFSEPKNNAVTTNLNQLGAKKNSLKELEDDLSKPFQSFQPNGSLDGVIAPPPVRSPANSSTPAQRQRARELLKKKEDWVFMLPEDMVSNLRPEEIFKLRDTDANGEKKESLSPFQQYYEKMFPQKNPAKGQSKDEDFLGLRKDERRNAAEQSDELSGKLGESEKSLRQLFGLEEHREIFPSSRPVNSFADVFGLNSISATERDKEAQKMFDGRMEEFRQVLQQSPSSFSPLAVDPLAPGDAPLRPLLTSPFDVNASAPSRKPFEPTAGTIAPRLSVPGLADSGSRPSYASPSLTPPPAPQEPPKPTLPPVVSVPRRRF